MDIQVTVYTLKNSAMDYITSQMSYTLSQLLKTVVSKIELNCYRNNLLMQISIINKLHLLMFMWWTLHKLMYDFTIDIMCQLCTVVVGIWL